MLDEKIDVPLSSLSIKYEDTAWRQLGYISTKTRNRNTASLDLSKVKKSAYKHL